MASSSPEPDAFPAYKDGEVEIVISPMRRFELHLGVLRRCSPVLADLLRHEGPKLSKKAATRGVKIRYRLVLEPVGQTFRFRRVELNNDGRTVDGSGVGCWNENGRVAPPEFHYYHMLFAAFYNLDLQMDKSSVGTVLRDAMGVLMVAENLGAVPFVLRSIESAFVGEGQALYDSIAQIPMEWNDVGYRLQSRWLFKESLIHIVGRYNEMLQTPLDEANKEHDGRCALDSLRPDIRAVVERKVAELRQMCRSAEQSIASYYPSHLYRRSATGRADHDDIGRKSYSNDIMAWMSLSLFRHWFAQQIALDESHNAKSGGFEFYKRIAAGGQAYLDKESVAGFHYHFPMSSKGQAVIENHLNAIKENIKSFVEPLFDHTSQIDKKSPRLNWLTCTKVTNGDYPWERQNASPVLTAVGGSDDDEEESEEEPEEMDDDTRHGACSNTEDSD